MNININKNLIFKACMSNQNELIDNIENRLNALNTSATSNNYSASQREDRAAGKVELLNALKKELNFAKLEMEYLKTIDPLIENTVVSSGAIVFTNQLIFFIGISSEKV